jgi:hypothetical protein
MTITPDTFRLSNARSRGQWRSRIGVPFEPERPEGSVTTRRCGSTGA